MELPCHDPATDAGAAIARRPAANGLGSSAAPVQAARSSEAGPALSEGHALTLDAGGTGIDAWTLMRVLDEIDYGVMLVDADAQVRYANRVALQECGGERSLRLDGGRVTTRCPADLPHLLRALASSGQGRRSLLSVKAGEAVLSLAVVPLTSAPLSAARTLLVLGKREACPTLSVDFFARAHHLTAAESAVLKGLCSGLRPVQIAAEGGVAISTVRTQIGAIRAKTGSSGIRELVGRVAALPPIASLACEMVRDVRAATAPRA